MARGRYSRIDSTIILDLGKAPSFILPPFNKDGEVPERLARSYPAESWTKEYKGKISFGTRGRTFSISQGKRRGLLRWDCVFRLYTRALRSREDEDRKIKLHDEKIARLKSANFPKRFA